MVLDTLFANDLISSPIQYYVDLMWRFPIDRNCPDMLLTHNAHFHLAQDKCQDNEESGKRIA